MNWWRWLMRRSAGESEDAVAVVEARKKLEQARRDTAWITDVAAPQLARLPQEQFVDRVRNALTLARPPHGDGA